MPELEDGTPYVAIGNSEPLPDWLLTKPELAELLTSIRAGRREAGWCDHGKRLASAPPRNFTDEICGFCR